MVADITLFISFLILLIGAAKAYSGFFTKVAIGDKNILTPLISPVEKSLYRLCGINPQLEMNWKKYALALMLFNGAGIVLVLAVLLSQHLLPLNPQGLPALPFELAFNTAISFVTNTNWQNYSGESTMSYFSQMFVLSVQNFLSASTGIAVAVAFMRGIISKESESIGNFWADMVRVTLYVLLPLSLVYALFLISQGVIQNFAPYISAVTLEGANQSIPMGPVASQEAIKMLGTNGGGFFNANSAHPFENPTPLSNFVQVFSILFLPISLLFVYGKMSQKSGEGRSILIAMVVLFVLMLGSHYASEKFGNPEISGIVGESAMEGKEVRFGIASTSLFSVATTAASCGAVNGMHDSLTPLAGMVTMVQMMLGEIVIGGVGAGFYGMMAYVILSVFIAGLMIGRTPEYMGKKIEAKEMTYTVVAVLLPGLCILLFTGLSLLLPEATSSISNPGPHGLSQVLYAFSSASGNNGSAFAGLSGNTLYYNYALALCMFVGRFGVIIPMLAIAGSLARKKVVPFGKGTLNTQSALFITLLVATILLTGALTFFPSLALGPVIEHLMMLERVSF